MYTSTHLALGEAFSVEDDLGNHGRVWHNHSNGSEHALEVIRQLCAPGIAWVHGDEDATLLVEVNLAALKDKPLGQVSQGLQDGEDLLRHHRQHLNVDAVKLVKTAPGSRLEQKERERT